MKRRQVKNQVKPTFFGIEQVVCNKKMVKNRVKLSLPLFFGLFPKNKPYSSRISLIPGEFRPILVEKVSTLWLLFNGEKESSNTRFNADIADKPQNSLSNCYTNMSPAY